MTWASCEVPNGRTVDVESTELCFVNVQMGSISS